MKRFAIIFSGTHWFFPKWLLKDQEKIRFVHFADYGLAKMVKEFYEDHPELEIPEFSDGWRPIIRRKGEIFIAANSMPQYDEVHVMGIHFHTVLLSYAEKARAAEKRESELVPSF